MKMSRSVYIETIKGQVQCGLFFDLFSFNFIWISNFQSSACGLWQVDMITLLNSIITSIVIEVLCMTTIILFPDVSVAGVRVSSPSRVPLDLEESALRRFAPVQVRSRQECVHRQQVIFCLELFICSPLL